MPPLRRFIALLIAVFAMSAGLGLIADAGLPARADYTGYTLDGAQFAPEVNALAPPFTAASLDGGSFDLLETRGRFVVVNFWATWCAPCEAELPLLAQFAADNRNTVRVIAVNTGETPDDATRWLTARGLSLPVAFDADGRIASLYQVRGQPSTYFIAPDGRILAIVYGALDTDALYAAAAPFL